jgi:hypothetical protein
MTKKHFQALANALRETRALPFGGGSVRDRGIADKVLDEVTERIIEACQRFNPWFNAHTFRQAADADRIEYERMTAGEDVD